MWRYIFLVFLAAVGASQGDSVFSHCDTERCDGSALRREFAGIEKYPPTGEEVKRICPFFIESMECKFNELKECTGQTILELAASRNASVSEFAQMALAISDLAIELCDEESQLHKDYMVSVDCFRQEVDDRQLEDPCRQESTEMYKSFREAVPFSTEDQTETDISADYEERCLRGAYFMACMANRIHKVCGEAAKRLLIQLVSRTHIAFDNPCSAVAKQILKGEFLDFLDTKIDQREEYESIFNMFKKK